MIIIRKLKVSLISIFAVLAIFTTTAYAENIEAKTEEVNDSIDLSTYSTTVSDEIIDFKENKVISNILNKTVSGFNTVGLASPYDSSYDLRDYYDIEVKNQGNTECCWAFSLLSSTEINMKLNNKGNFNFSERHMNYATSESFYDGNNEYAFNREAKDGGSTIIGLAYLTNGQGAVLEDEMKYSEDTSSISLKEIDIEPSVYVTGYEMLPTIYKIKSNNEILYTDGYGKYYTDEEVTALRKIIKEHIIKYGAISTYMAASGYEYYNNSNIFDATAYYCDDMSLGVDHAVTIVGWDDNYSKDNFTGKVKPSKDGAYIVLNSYSDSAFDNGYIYISYEDVWIETMLYGITSTSDINYDNLYQHDSFGANVPLTLTSNGESLNEGYYASIYSRDKSKLEYLSQVSISTNQYAKFEIYVNPNGDDLNTENLVLVSSTGVLSPGYNTINFDAIRLNGEKFAVVVKQIATNETYYFMIEAEVDGTFYENTTANAGDSKVSVDGKTWYNLADLGQVSYSGYLVDLSKADVCVKSFTTICGISTDKYNITSDNYIMGIENKTKIEDFLKDVNITDEYSFINKQNEKVSDYSKFVTTDMKLVLDDKTFNLVVMGDLNGDGKITITDLSKQALHFVRYEGYILSGAYDKAADINLDGKLTITDLSKLRLMFVNL